MEESCCWERPKCTARLGPASHDTRRGFRSKTPPYWETKPPQTELGWSLGMEIALSQTQCSQDLHRISLDHPHCRIELLQGWPQNPGTQHETGVPGLDALRWLPGKVLHPYRISTCFRSEILIFHDLFWESEVLSNPALASTRSRCTQTSGSISHMPPACQLEKAEAAEQSLWEMCPQQNQASPRQPGSICMQSTLK